MKRFFIVAITAVSIGCGSVKKLEDRAIFTTRGAHPAVAWWYYELHPRAFKCKDDPYSCDTCPVGPTNRVVNIPDKFKHYVVVPTSINAYFSCDDINRLVPASDAVEDWDTFLCERKPWTGSIIIDGTKIGCDSQDPGPGIPLGDIGPGESKTITIPLVVQDKQ